MAPRRSVAALRRVERRDELWPEAHLVVFDRTDRSEKGWGTVPRTLGLIGTLIKHLGDRVDGSKVFLDLWFRNFDDGMIEVDDEMTFAACCG